jgi:hypothetical protein
MEREFEKRVQAGKSEKQMRNPTQQSIYAACAQKK